jgi:hypothetical protein
MTEIEKLEEFLATKSKNTAVSYRRQYKVLLDLLDRDINSSGEKVIILATKTLDNINSIQAMLNIAIVVKKLHNKPHTLLIEQRDKNKAMVEIKTKETNIELTEKLPSYKTLVEYTNKLYDKNKFTEYVVNYLLINYFVRNQDLLFEIVPRKKDAIDKNMNYMWLPKHGKKCEYVRNNYKTAETYGKKTIVITDPNFILAIKRINACAKYNLDCGTIIPTDSQVGYYVKKMTYEELGEGSYFKIAVNHFKNDLQMLKLMSKYRGTDVNTIISKYDINNK